MFNINNIKNTFIQGHVLNVLKEIPDNSINMAITSPPYYGLRNYNIEPQLWGGHNDCSHKWIGYIKKGITGGISPALSIKGVENFQLVKDSKYLKCEKCDAIICELGQELNYHSYLKHLLDIFNEVKRVLRNDGSCWINLGDSYFNKSLAGIPDRFKILMIDNGWFCRNEIIWHKPNIMPTSAKDRFTNDFEKIYWFTKNNEYFFKQQFEDCKFESKQRYKYRFGGTKYEATGNTPGIKPYSGKRNMRSVWTINTKGIKDAHFAIFPDKLIEIPILASCPDDGIVLDIFMGSGTVARMAKKLNRNFIGIELNSEYIEIANKRLAEIK